MTLRRSNTRERASVESFEGSAMSISSSARSFSSSADLILGSAMRYPTLGTIHPGLEGALPDPPRATSRTPYWPTLR